ncbi:protein TIS11 isoform X2 [Nasonia vitripennis]|nr:protein TIS11 isoform X2 [Nasonia vitripennis]
MPSTGHTPLRRSYTSLVNLIEQHRKLDRTVSEPTSRYKTELCRPFEESGSCKYGDKCQFAHGYNELRNLARHPKYKTELCRTFHKIGFCPYGPRCHFVHNFEEARIHNLKVSAQLHEQQQHNLHHQQQQNPTNIVNLSPLLQPGTTAALSVNVSLLEQLTNTSQLSAAVIATSANNSNQLVRTNSLNFANPTAPIYPSHQTLHRSNSLGIAQHQHNLHAICSRPKPLNLSPTFSLGSTADSVSPSSSLSQSPTNSMASFFSDETVPSSGATTLFSFGQDFNLLNNNNSSSSSSSSSTRQSPSPQNILEEISPRTPSPLSPNVESRLPVFNRISSTLVDLKNLKI